jgi:hypothetical protein
VKRYFALPEGDRSWLDVPASDLVSAPLPGQIGDEAIKGKSTVYTERQTQARYAGKDGDPTGEWRGGISPPRHSPSG